MGYSAASPPPLRSTNLCRDTRRPFSRGFVPFRPFNPFWGFSASKQRKRVCLFSSPPERGPIGGAWNSWLPQGGSSDGFGGWLVSQPESEKKGDTFNYFPRSRTVGVGASVAVLLAALVHVSFSRKGSKFQLNMLLHALHGLVRPLESGSKSQDEDNQISEQILEDESATTRDTFIPMVDTDMPERASIPCQSLMRSLT